MQVGPHIARLDPRRHGLVAFDFHPSLWVADLDRDDLVAHEDGFALAVRVAGERAELAEPHGLAIEIKAAHRAAAVKEPHVLAIGDGRKDGAIAENARRLHRVRARKIDGPENLARVRIEAVADDVGLQPVAGFSHRTMRRNESAITPDRHRALSALRQRRAPEDVFAAHNRPRERRLGPFDFPVEVRPGRLRPVLGTDRGSQSQRTESGTRSRSQDKTAKTHARKWVRFRAVLMGKFGSLGGNAAKRANLHLLWQEPELEQARDGSLRVLTSAAH